MPLARVLEAVDAGTAMMLPPTVLTCRELSEFTAADILAASAEREVTPIEPRIVEVDGELFLDILPGGVVSDIGPIVRPSPSVRRPSAPTTPVS